MLRILSPVGTLALLATVAQAQRLLFEHRGTTTWGAMGNSVAFVGDVDKDGHEDYAVGEVGARDARKLRTGAVHVFSGKDGRRLYLFFGDAADDGFGVAVSAAGDVNRDGYPDLVVGAPGSIVRKDKGYVRVFSGRDGKVLHTFSGSQPLQSYGRSVATAGDLDRDGHDDVIIGSWGWFVRSRVWIRSGKDGSVLRWWQGPWPKDFFGLYLAGGVDLNGDGYGEVLVAAPSSIGSSISVFDGRYGNLIHRFLPGPSDSIIGAGGGSRSRAT